MCRYFWVNVAAIDRFIMARKRTFTWLLAMVTLYVLCKYFVPPSVYLYKRINGWVRAEEKEQPDTVPLGFGKNCQLERPLFMQREELLKFRISHPSKYKPVKKMTIMERESLIALLDLVQVYLNRNKIPYVLAYQTLLGSYVMHDVLPFESTVHLLARKVFNKTVADSVENDDKLEAVWNSTGVPNYTHVRFFAKTSEHEPPFVELHFFDENTTHVWTMMPPPRKVVMKIGSFYPFHERPFASHWYPTPKDPRQFLLKLYSKVYYEFRIMNSTKYILDPPKKKPVKGAPPPPPPPPPPPTKAPKDDVEITMKVSWRVIRNFHPMVRRINCGAGVKETLICHHVDQYHVYIEEEFPNNTIMLGLG